MFQRTVAFSPRGRGLYDITNAIEEIVAETDCEAGLCHVFLQHTSASLTIQENADPAVLADLADWYHRNVADGDPRYRHSSEGPDDMSAHIRVSLTDTSVTIPICRGRLALGTWQGLYLFEHRTSPMRRRVVVTIAD
jgi:secondary thiamine-phosphate synthase enzyme